jgi:hypothetical protein
LGDKGKQEEEREWWGDQCLNTLSVYESGTREASESCLKWGENYGEKDEQ